MPRTLLHFLKFGLAFCALTLVSHLSARTTSRALRTLDGSNLRQIGQASLIYANDHKNGLPEATDVWDYARLLAQDAGLDVANMWVSRIDPAYEEPPEKILTEGKAGERTLTPAFRKTKPSVAVILGKIHTDMRATTPIAWTRGLQPDGTWAPHSPYGADGGYIMFLGGNIVFYKNGLQGNELPRFDGKGTTVNILEALPPGSRTSEYIPTPEEAKAWATAKRNYHTHRDFHDYGLIMGLCVVWLPFVSLSIYRLIQKRPGAFSVLIWPLLLSILAAIIVPTC